jgi:carboxylesterase
MLQPLLAGAILANGCAGGIDRNPPLKQVKPNSLSAVNERRNSDDTSGSQLPIPCPWIGGDLVYSLLMKQGYARWEAGIQRDPDGVRKGCREYTLLGGDTALLLIHGFGDSPASYQRMAPALAQRGYTCRVMRLPGFAMPMADYIRTNSAQWRKAVISELQTLRQTHRRVIVIAHSLGGAVTLDSLAEYPDTADGVVLLAPLLDVCNQRSPLLPARAWFHILDRTLIFTDRIEMAFPPDLRDKEALARMKEDKYVPRIVYREMFALLDRNRPRAKRFRAPLFLVLSKTDPVVDNRAAEHFYQECGSVMKRLKYTEEAGHVIPMDHGWQELVVEIDEFIQRLPPSGTQGKSRLGV